MIPFIAGLAIGAVIGVCLMSVLTMGKFADLECTIAQITEALETEHDFASRWLSHGGPGVAEAINDLTKPRSD